MSLAIGKEPSDFASRGGSRNTPAQGPQSQIRCLRVIRSALTAVLKNNDTPERELERYARL